MYLRLLVLPALVACNTTELEFYEQCDVQLNPRVESPVLPTSAAPGESIVLTVGPMSFAYDTAVLVGSVRARVLDISRTDCADYDVCRESSECLVCEACTPMCTSERDSCIETLIFEVPSMPEGSAPITITNAYGASAPIAFVVLEGDTDTDPGDTDTDTGTN